MNQRYFSAIVISAAFILGIIVANSFYGAAVDESSRIKGRSVDTSHTDQLKDNSPSKTIENQKKNKTLAVCIVGGLRTFHLDVVRQSLARNALNALEPDPSKRQVFFHVDDKFHCGSNSMNNGMVNSCRRSERLVSGKRGILESEEIKELFGADRQIFVDSDFTCTGTPFLSQHQCCINKQEGSTSAWNTFLAYQRKLACLEEVKKHEVETGVYFENFLIIRPDLYFFEPLPPVTTLARYNRVLMSAKEVQQSPGDYFFIFPRSMLERFERMNKALHEDVCVKGDSHNGMPWPLEYKMTEYLNKDHEDETRALPYQVFPFFFTIVRPNGNADCFRLKTEVYTFAKTSYPGLRGTSTPEQICNHAVKKGLFSFKISKFDSDEHATYETLDN